MNGVDVYTEYFKRIARGTCTLFMTCMPDATTPTLSPEEEGMYVLDTIQS